MKKTFIFLALSVAVVSCYRQNDDNSINPFDRSDISSQISDNNTSSISNSESNSSSDTISDNYDNSSSNSKNSVDFTLPSIPIDF